MNVQAQSMNKVKPLPEAKTNLLGAQRKCGCGSRLKIGGQCNKECTANERTLQRRRLADLESAQIPDSVNKVVGASGRSLDTSTRNYFEPKFGYDFSKVRVHNNMQAARSARDIKARAYTVGHNIVFANGQYSLGNKNSQQLLAHELTHVVQQSTRGSSPGIAPSDDAAEKEADHNVSRIEANQPLTFTQRANRISRQAQPDTSVTVTTPTGHGVCSVEQSSAIEPAVGLAQQWLGSAITKLDGYIAAPTNTANQAVSNSLNRHFHSSSIPVARRIRSRVNQIRTDMVSRTPFTTECHDATDIQCTNTGAYIPGSNQGMVVFCSGFFSSSSNEWRAAALIHEFAHTITGLRISDRAYESDRLLPFLSTAEALDNAESYNMLVQELATNTPVHGSPPQDELEDCSDAVTPLIREALGRAQRWNRDAESLVADPNPAMQAHNAPLFTTHLGDALPATRANASRFFSSMVVRLRRPVNIQCDPNASAQCGARGVYRREASDNTLAGLGIGAGIGGGVGLIAGIAVGLAVGPIGIAVGLGLLALGGLIGLIAGAASSEPESIHVCPVWSAQTADDRAEFLLAVIYETYGELNQANSRSQAAFARAVNSIYIGAPPPV